MPEPLNLLIKLPSRGRAKTLMSTLGDWRAYMSDRFAHHHFVIIADEDDADTLALRERLFDMERVRMEVVPPKGATAAFNVPLVEGFDVIVALHDDAKPLVRGWDNELRDAFARFYPDLDGIIALDGANPCAIPAVGREYATRGGRDQVYHEGYRGRLRYADLEARAGVLGRIRRSAQPLATHFHSSSGSCDEDAALYDTRNGTGFGIRVWDILICTIVGREASCGKLVEKLQRQIDELGLVGRVGVLVEKDDCSMSTGEKRNILMRRSVAEYVCYVDDDDDVSDDYVRTVWEGVRDCSVDCVGLVGKIKEGSGWRAFFHSNKYRNYDSPAEGYTRPPNHLNAIRRSIARRYPFKDIYGGEDTDYAIRMLAAKELQTEFAVSNPIYLYTPGSAWMGKDAGR